MELDSVKPQFLLPSSTETGKINIMHLKRFWSKSAAKREGNKHHHIPDEWVLDTTLLSALGLGIEQTMRYLYLENPDFDTFEDWILEINGQSITEEKIERFNNQITNNPPQAAGNIQPTLNGEQMDFWNENGYIILRNAVPKTDCDATVQLICDFLTVDINDPATWYNLHPAKQGIMVQLFQHPLLQKNRDSPIIKAAYEQLWRRKDIWVNTDRVGFNPPETETYHFSGPHLHWDVSIAQPIPFGLQGILYLTDTKANQGAFTLVPGFQNRIAAWMDNLPTGTNPRTQNMHALGSKPIAANAGDFIIWHHALPHGSSPNTSIVPRFVQYINYAPLDPEMKRIWI